MDDGDAFKFSTLYTPHFGQKNINGIRYSVESRYILLPFNFDLKDVFEIRDNNLVVRTKEDQEGNTTPQIIPPYLPLTSYKYFEDQFNIIKKIYDKYKKKKTEYLNMEMFKELLDNIPFETYMTEEKYMKEYIELWFSIS